VTIVLGEREPFDTYRSNSQTICAAEAYGSVDFHILREPREEYGLMKFHILRRGVLARSATTILGYRVAMTALR
jgi:hypothetical protein